MRWFAVHHDLATNRKWMSLPMDLRGAWITMLTIAAASTPRGRIRDRATAEALIKREMQADDLADPDYYIDELIDRGWVDEDEVDGTLTFHDFDDWQLAIRKPSDLPDKIRERVDRHRRRKAENPPDPPKGNEKERTGEVTDGNARNALPAPPSSCPECDGVLKEKVAKNGGTFIGCDRFPACNYIQRATPKPKVWTPSAADLAIIEEQTPTLRRVS